MLQAIRDHLTGWVAVLLFIVIGLAFALWGVPNQSTATASPAQVNGEEIPLDQIRRAVRNQVAQFRQYSEVSPEYEKVIREQVLQGLVRDEVFSQHTQASGYRIGDAALVNHVRNMQEFQDQGQFSMDLMRARLTPQGVSPQYFEAQVRRSLRVSQLRRGIVESAFVTKAELEQRARLEREQRTAEWIKINREADADQLEITAAEIQTYYEANPDSFMQPESVDLAYVELNLAEMAEQTPVTDDELQDYYDGEVAAGRFQAPEERQARHILVSVDGETDDTSAREKIEALLQRVKNGDDFAAIATEESDDPGSAPEGGDLGWAQKTAYVGAFADALFAMQPGDISDPVRTQFGYHIIRMEGQRGGVAKPFDEVSAELKQELSLRQAETQFFDLADQMRDLSFENSGSLDPIADGLGLEIKRLTGVTRSGGEGIAANPALRDAAFSESVLDARQNSDPVNLTNDTQVVVRVENYHPAVVRPLAEVSDAIKASLAADAARERVATQGVAILQRVRGGESLAELATEYGAELHEDENYRRTSGLPSTLRVALFKAPKPVSGNPVVDGVALDDGSYAVFVLKDVLPGDTSNLGAPETVAGQQGMGDLTAYYLELAAAASVQLRPELLE